MPLPVHVAIDLPFELARAPWSLLMAIASLGIIYVLFKRRSDVFADLGLSGKEVALLCLGSIAGWAVNLPLAVIGGTYLAVNVGGTLIPVILVGWWIKSGKLRVLPALVGIGIVSIIAWRIVEFHPDEGIVAEYPTFFLPVVAALVFALLVSLRKPAQSVRLAYASGSIGALVGADVLHMGEISAHFRASPENTIISIGGAGVLDMVFLAGTLAMALNIALVVGFAGRRPPALAPDAYPGKPVSIEDSARVYREFQRIESPNAVERALAGVALSDIALREGDFGRSVRMSWLAVDSLLQARDVQAYVGNGVDPLVRDDIEALRRQYVDSRSEDPPLRAAGEANVAAKTLVAALAARAGATQTLTEALRA